MNRFFSVVAFVSVSSLAFDADARRERVGQIPNGAENGCANCHISANGGGARNAFGIAVEGTLVGGVVDWAAIYNLDSDGDGYTNGEELGDPDGAWTTGAAGPYLSHPGEQDSTPCGNGTIEGPEECDGEALGDATCEAAGFGTGTVSCTTACELNFSECENPPANNEPGNNGTNNATNNATNNEPGNNATNNEPGNNATNNEPGNNEPGNNEPGNNATNNEPGNNQPGPTDSGSSDDDGGCSTTGGTSAPLALLFGFFLLRLRRRG